MAECLHCQVSYEYGKKFCKKCGGELIESKELLDTAKDSIKTKNFNAALESIKNIPSFSVFYGYAQFLSLEILYGLKEYDKLKKIIIEKPSWKNLAYNEKQKLYEILLFTINSLFNQQKYEEALDIIEIIKDNELETDEKLEIIEGEIYLSIARNLLKEEKNKEAIPLLEKAIKYNNQIAKRELAEIYYKLSKNYFDIKNLKLAQSEISKSIKYCPEESQYLLFSDQLNALIKAKKLKNKKIIYITASTLFGLVLIGMIYYLFFLGEVRIIINYSEGKELDSTNLNVFIDDDKVDPATFVTVQSSTLEFTKFIPTGEKEIIVLAKYFLPETLKVDLSNSKNQTYNIILKPKLVDLTINSSPEGSMIRLNDILHGKTPLSIKGLKCGTYVLQLFNQDYYTYNEQLDIDSTTMTINANLKSRVLLYDDFNFDNKGWAKFNEPGFGNKIVNGTYTFNNTTDKYLSIGYLEKTFNNIELITSISVINSRDTYSFGGIQFWGDWSRIWQKSYFLEFTKNGYLCLGYNTESGSKFLSNGYNNWQKLDHLSSNRLSYFTLKLLLYNGNIEIYINGKLELHLTNNTYSPGHIALLCGPNSSIKFNYIKILDYDSDNRTKNTEQKVKQEINAIINDPDGFTNLRSGPGTQYEIVKKILETEIFYVVSQQGNWWQVKTKDGKYGYIHNSRIKLIN